MQSIEMHSKEKQKYITPPRKSKGHSRHLDEQHKNPQKSIDQSNLKYQSVYTPSTGQITSNHNKTQQLSKDHPKNQSFQRTFQNQSHIKQPKIVQEFPHSNQNGKIKIRLFRQNTEKKNTKQCKLLQISQQRLKHSRQKSRKKKGLSLLKNLIAKSNSSNNIKVENKVKDQPFNKKTANLQVEINSSKQLKQQQQNFTKNEKRQDDKLSQFSPVKHSDFFLTFIEKEVQPCYCKSFLIRIYGKIVRDWKVSKFNFGMAMLEEGLISDLVKERHLIQKLWVQICQLIQDPTAQKIELGTIFAVFVSFLGYSVEQIDLFNYLESIISPKNDQDIKSQKHVYEHFVGRKQMFKIKRLSMPQKL